MGIPPFIVLSFVTLHRHCIFYKLRARSFTSKTITVRFIVILTLLWCSGTKPEISEVLAFYKLSSSGSDAL